MRNAFSSKGFQQQIHHVALYSTTALRRLTYSQNRNNKKLNYRLEKGRQLYSSLQVG